MRNSSPPQSAAMSADPAYGGRRRPQALGHPASGHGLDRNGL
ncbi:MAG: hypothetical protein ACLTTU_03575 [Bilophila wadsworthia]